MLQDQHRPSSKTLWHPGWLYRKPPTQAEEAELHTPAPEKYKKLQKLTFAWNKCARKAFQASPIHLPYPPRKLRPDKSASTVVGHRSLERQVSK